MLLNLTRQNSYLQQVVLVWQITPFGSTGPVSVFVNKYTPNFVELGVFFRLDGDCGVMAHHVDDHAEADPVGLKRKGFQIYDIQKIYSKHVNVQ